MGGCPQLCWPGPTSTHIYVLKRKSSNLFSLIQLKDSRYAFLKRNLVNSGAQSTPIGPLLMQPLVMLTWDLNARACVGGIISKDELATDQRKI